MLLVIHGCELNQQGDFCCKLYNCSCVFIVEFEEIQRNIEHTNPIFLSMTFKYYLSACYGELQTTQQRHLNWIKYLQMIKDNIIWDALRNLVAFVQFKKREKQP